MHSKFVVRLLLFTNLLFVAGESHAQVAASVLNESERGYFQTLSDLTFYLRKNKTPVLSSHGRAAQFAAEAFYNKVVDSFFEGALSNAVGRDTKVPGSKGMLDSVRHLLNQFDRCLDTVQPSAILVEPIRSSPAAFNGNDAAYKNTLHTWRQRGGKKTFMLTFVFDEKSNKIVAVFAQENPAGW